MTLKKIDLILYLIVGVLLGIWATTNTIALRNVLLVLGTIVSLIYLICFIKLPIKKNSKLNQLRPQYVPTLLVMMMILWVCIHVSFFSNQPQLQIKELTSTWLRASLAIIIGYVCGIAMQVNKKNTWIIWIGLIISFLILIFQYVPKALKNQSLYATDFFGNYIYFAKYNGVLSGIILISGLLGFLIDRFGWDFFRTSIIKYKNIYLSLIMIGILLPLYSFIFIFDSKNGLGISIIIIIPIILIALMKISNNLREKNRESQKKYIVIILIIICLITTLFAEQNKKNPGWKYLFEDFSIALDIVNNEHWKNPRSMGYPVRKDGKSVAHNTYERVSWGFIGLKIIFENPLGNGLTQTLPEQMKAINIDFSASSYTHSGWIDLGLAYGIPGILLIPLCLIMILVNQIFIDKNNYYRATIIILSSSILILYSLGEYGFKHGIEILFFLVSMLCSLNTKNECSP